MDERISDEEQPVTVLRKNHFSAVALYCVCAIFVLLLTGPFMMFIPLVCIIGAIAGIIGLIQVHRVPEIDPDTRQAWTGITLCTVIFIIVGLFVSQLCNYAQSPQIKSKLREIVIYLNMYAHDHQGQYPASTTELGLPPEKLSYKIFHFYYLHSERPYLFNGNLAGKKIDLIAYPERTLVIAPGKIKGATVFHNQAEIDLEGRGFAFVDGHNEYLSEWKNAKRFPSDGTVSDKTWFIKPRMKK